MLVLTMQLQQFKIENLFFMDQVKNLIMKNGYFVKFLYSDEDCVINSLFFELPIQNTGIEQIYYKNKLIYDPQNPINNALIHALYNVEKSILEYYDHNGKKPIYKISENAFHGNIQFMKNYPHMDDETIGIKKGELPKNPKILVKFSGIWENSLEYGIIYKFILYDGADDAAVTHDKN